MPAQPQKRENLFINLGCNVALPSIILTWGSKATWLGPKWALVVALIFPVAYSIYDFVVRKKFNFISALGFVSVLVTGTFALMKLDPFWFAVKEAAVPAAIGLVVLASMGTRWPLVKEMLYNPQVIDVDRIDAILEGGRTSAGFHYAGPLSETVQLGNVATRVALPPSPKRGSNIVAKATARHWDAAQRRLTHHPAAQALLTNTYRPGWEVSAA